MWWEWVILEVYDVDLKRTYYYSTYAKTTKKDAFDMVKEQFSNPSNYWTREIYFKYKNTKEEHLFV